MPNLLPRSILGFTVSWLRPAGRIVWFSLAFFIGIAIVITIMKRVPKTEEGPTWAQALAGAVGTAALMFLGYAVLPHEWLKFADKYLQWSDSRYFFKARSAPGVYTFLLSPKHNGEPILRFDFTLKAIRDIVATMIYGVAIALNLRFWYLWQHRGEPKPEKAPKPEAAARFSKFGRPLRRKATVNS